jgi:hypothetical protein
MPEQLAKMPTMPEHGEKLWLAFQDLHVTRRSGFGGPERFGFADIHAMQIVTGIHLAPWEVRGLFALDREYMAFAASEAKTK